MIVHNYCSEIITCVYLDHDVVAVDGLLSFVHPALRHLRAAAAQMLQVQDKTIVQQK